MMPAPHAAAAPPAGAPLATPLSQRLRHGTADLHGRIEQNSRFGRLMSPELTLAEYRGLVERLYGHHGPAEAALAGAAPLLPVALDLPRRLRRATLLAGDLRALGLSVHAIAALPCCLPGTYAIATAEAAWGTLYVLEGSALGGQVIARHLAARLGLGSTTGAAGMVPHGEETGMLWRQFRQLLDETAVLQPLDAEAVIDAARHAFATLDAWVAAAGDA